MDLDTFLIISSGVMYVGCIIIRRLCERFTYVKF